MPFKILVANKELSQHIRPRTELYARVSIQCVKDHDIQFNDSDMHIGTLHLKFNDVKSTEDGHMIESQAKKTIEFMNSIKDRISTLIVNCCGGVSRSAGMAAAIGKIYNGDDSFIFSNTSRRYVPNMHVYRMVLNASGESIRK